MLPNMVILNEGRGIPSQRNPGGGSLFLRLVAPRRGWHPRQRPWMSSCVCVVPARNRVTQGFVTVHPRRLLHEVACSNGSCLRFMVIAFPSCCMRSLNPVSLVQGLSFYSLRLLPPSGPIRSPSLRGPHPNPLVRSVPCVLVDPICFPPSSLHRPSRHRPCCRQIADITAKAPYYHRDSTAGLPAMAPQLHRERPPAATLAVPRH